MNIIVVGSIGRFPVAGHAWVNLQYLRGFEALGHQVYYLEDCGEQSYVYHWDEQKLTSDLAYPARFIEGALTPAGFGNRWAYRAGEEIRGMSIEAVQDVCANADLLLVRGAPLPVWREEYLRIPSRAYLDVDPMFTQVIASREQSLLHETVRNCDVLFTIAKRMGAPHCAVPDLGRTWHPTVSPVYLPDWPMVEPPLPDAMITTIMQWSAYKAVEWEGRSYGNKTREFPRFIAVAEHAPAQMCIAMTGQPPTEVQTDGWHIIDGVKATATTEMYQKFIQHSLAEFSVAKHGYVVSRGGWFSDRSACYLASGRPVIVQDTGLADWLPVGQGVVTFTNLDEALRAVQTVLGSYERHRSAARRIAESYFSTTRVLPAMLAKLA